LANVYRPGEFEIRPWGKWTVIEVGKGFTIKTLEINPGELLSLQRHNFRTETWKITNGHGIITLDNEKRPVKAGDTFVVPVKTWHRLENTGTEKLVIHETQTSDTGIIDENDIERIEDKYARKSEQIIWNKHK